MKHSISLILISTILCSCVSATKPAPVVAKEDYQPPSNFDWDFQQKEEFERKLSDRELIAIEQDRYEESLVNIENQIQTEHLNLQMTASMYGEKSKQYLAMKSKYCEVDMLLDTRSDHHTKYFCKK